MADKTETPAEAPKFDFSAYPEDSVFYERRDKLDRREDLVEAPVAAPPAPAALEAPHRERRARKDRRKRIDPTTFEKQYSDDEMEFMTAMQRFKIKTGKTFPNHAEVIGVAVSLGYRLTVFDGDESGDGGPFGDDPSSGDADPTDPAFLVMSSAG